MMNFFSWPSDAWLLDLELTGIALDIGGAQTHFEHYTYESNLYIDGSYSGSVDS